MYDLIYPSADSSVTGIVTLLAAAQALQKHKDMLSQADKTIMYSLFNGVSLVINTVHVLGLHSRFMLPSSQHFLVQLNGKQ